MIADFAPVLVWTSGPNKLRDFFNERWLKFTGRTMQQELGNGWAETIHPEDFDLCFDTYVSAFEARRSFTIEYRLRQHDGEHRWVLENGQPRYTRFGEFDGYIGCGVDVTEQRELRERLEHFARQHSRPARSTVV